MWCTYRVGGDDRGYEKRCRVRRIGKAPDKQGMVYERERVRRRGVSSFLCRSFCLAMSTALALLPLRDTQAATATVTDLRPALLQNSDLPSGFSTKMWGIFSKPSLKLPVHGRACGLTSTRERSDWRQGVHEVFPVSGIPFNNLDGLDVCALLLRHPSVAKSEFASVQHQAQLLFLHRSNVRALAAINIGNGAIAGITTLSTSTSYFLVFRSANAIVGLVYNITQKARVKYHKKALLSTTAFMQLARLISTRLQTIS